MQVRDKIADNFGEIRNQAIRYLSYREHAISEMRAKLLKKFDSVFVIDQVLAFLLDEDLLSEERYAESYIRVRVSKGYGPEHIRNELSYKGISKSVIRQSFDLNEIDWDQEIRKVWAKKYQKISVESQVQDRAKQWRFLLYRGFSRDQINRLFEESFTTV